MKTMFDFFICCRNSQIETSIITLLSQSENKKETGLKSPYQCQLQLQPENSTKPNTNTNTNCNTNVNHHLNSPKNSNTVISSQSQLQSQYKVKSQSNISILTVENIHVKESNFSFPEIDTELLLGKELKLKGVLFFNKEIIIDRLGIKAMKRKKVINSETIFGFTEEKDRFGRFINDFIVNYSMNKNGETTLFSIKYLKSEELYEMTMQNRDLSLYHLIDYSLFFNTKRELKFLIGKILVKVKVEEDVDNNDDDNGGNSFKISIQDQDKEKEGEKEYVFKHKDLPIVIGRVNATITIPSNSISKSHAIIDYSDDMKMYFIQDMGSTNKTYLILNKGDKLTIKNDMKFKLGETRFEIIEYNPK